MKIMTLSLVVSAALIGLQTVSAHAGSYQGPTGLELYSLRADFAKDIPGTLKFARSLGFYEVELGDTRKSYKQEPAEFKKLLEANGLKPVAVMLPFEKFRDDVEGAAADAEALGVKFAGCAWAVTTGSIKSFQTFTTSASARRASNFKSFSSTGSTSPARRAGVARAFSNGT